MRVCGVIFLLLMPSLGFAAEFSASNVQLLAGSGFDDRISGVNSRSGALATFSAERLDVRDWGDSFMFIDVNFGRLQDFGGARRSRSQQAYFEWQPRLALSTVGTSALRQVFIASQINLSDGGFKAGLLGLGADFNVPGFVVLQANLFARNDNFNAPTAQLSSVWVAPLGASGWFSEGFIDISGTDSNGTDVIAQPRLMFSASKTLDLGLELYYHHSDRVSTCAPQFIVKLKL